MLRRPLARLTSRRGPIGLGLVLALTPLPAWTEELTGQAPGAAAGDPALTPTPPLQPGTEPLSSPQTPPSESAWALDRTIPDDPWLAVTTPGPEAQNQVPCDPWNRAAHCTEEAEGAVLSNPWPAELPAAPESAPPAEVSAADEADLRLRLRGEAVDLRVDVEWPKASVPVSCVPTEATVRVEGQVDDRRVSGRTVGQISPLDLLVVDLGVPEAPFD